MIPEDVEQVLEPVCAHRLMLSGKARLHEYTAAGLLEEIKKTVHKPDVKEFQIG